MITYLQDLYMDHSGLLPEVKLKQYDSDFQIVFSLKNRKGSFVLESGTTAKIRGTKPDGYGYSVDAAINISEKTVTVAGDQQMTAVAGTATYEIVLYKGAKELNSMTILLLVEKAALSDDSIISDSEISDFRQAINAAAQAAASATTASGKATEAAESATDAAESAAAAEQYAEQAASVFEIAGDAMFIVNNDKSVTLRFTKED